VGSSDLFLATDDSNPSAHDIAISVVFGDATRQLLSPLSLEMTTGMGMTRDVTPVRALPGRFCPARGPGGLTAVGVDQNTVSLWLASNLLEITRNSSDTLSYWELVGGQNALLAGLPLDPTCMELTVADVDQDGVDEVVGIEVAGSDPSCQPGRGMVIHFPSCVPAVSTFSPVSGSSPISVRAYSAPLEPSIWELAKDRLTIRGLSGGVPTAELRSVSLPDLIAAAPIKSGPLSGAVAATRQGVFIVPIQPDGSFGKPTLIGVLPPEEMPSDIAAIDVTGDAITDVVVLTGANAWVFPGHERSAP
jgi:hypothetical protein